MKRQAMVLAWDELIERFGRIPRSARINGMVARFRFSRSDVFQAAVVYALLCAVFPGARTPTFHTGIGLLLVGLLWLASFQIAIVIVYRIFAGGLRAAELCQRLIRRESHCR
jgi:hypothetical protein